MNIRKIQKISKYKSYRDYWWPTFFNKEAFHPKTNILYGENGSGKTTICNILKSISKDRDFIKYYPKEVKIQINKITYKFQNQSWDKTINRGSILFFDREFVDNNVHLGRGRGTQQDEQEQKSAKLIIEFDAEAIKLRKKRDELAEIKESKHKILEEYLDEHQTILGFSLAEDEEVYYRKYKTKNKDRIDKIKKLLEVKKSDIDNKTKNGEKLLQKVTEIQQIPELNTIGLNLYLSRKAVYQAVFSFELKERAKIRARVDLIEKIKVHKDFFEKGFEIRQSHPKRCPFCQTKNRETEIKHLIEIYEDLYDDTYKRQKAIFESQKQNLTNELENIANSISTIDLNEIFLTLKKLSDQYSIKGIYSVGEEEQFRKKVPHTKLDELKRKIINLDKPSKDDISLLYREARTEFTATKKFISGLVKLIKRKNKLIDSFKRNHTDQKLKDQIMKNQFLLEQITSELDFIRSNRLENEKLRREKFRKLQKLQSEFEKAKETHRIIRENYEEYCSTDAFTKVLNKIESYFQYFDFSFKLQLDTQNRHTSSTKEMPFAFKVLDLEGNERDLREGLSEGEIQVLSICFFFAFLDIHGGKDQKILVFDDPITSLDDSNLSNLVDLVAKEKENLSQLFVLTHHRTFFKFLRKRFDNKCSEYLILRNKDYLGGSFICKSREERFIKRLKGFEKHLVRIAQNPQGFDIELKIVEFGQYLRYETEHFIKCRLLHWHKSERFLDVIDGIKENKKVSNTDLDKIKQIYSFCNWTTSHVDVGDDHGLAQLKEKINDFITISDKY